MKKNKKIIRVCIIIVSVCVLLTLSKGVYWYYKLEGMNVPIIVSTQYSPVPASIKIYIDGKIVFEDDSLRTLYKSQRIHLSCGIHKLKVVVDQEEIIKYFLVFPVRWIYIEVQKDNKSNYKNDENWFSIRFSFSPIGLL